MKQLDTISGPRGRATIWATDTSVFNMFDDILGIPNRYALYINRKLEGHYNDLHEVRSVAHRLVGGR